ncbi:hypothetical protein ECC01_21325 [Bacillus tequilensis]|nr:hypothetical protein [Bacillus tequilensis]
MNGLTGEITLTAADVGAATTAQGAKADTAVQPATLASYVPTTRTVAGKPLSGNVSLVKGDVGLGNVDNTSDLAKPVSTAQQTALAAKVPTSRTVAGKPLSANVTLAKGDVGLGNVDNTSDANKPVSTAQAAAINAKVGSDATVLELRAVETEADLPAGGAPAGVFYIVKG